MTTLTGPTKLPVMHIVIQVAGPTIGSLLYLGFHGFDMALATAQILVGSLKLKIGLRIVIKYPQLPVIGVMTATTLRT